jgi:glycosyltransferase involved in cell wall biosynthesis
MKVIFSAVLDGMVTGQTVTSEFMIRCLSERSAVTVNRQPARGALFPVRIVCYVVLSMLRFMLIRPNISYIMLNRTRVSFYTRDLIVIVFSAIFARKLIIHVVGNDFEKYWMDIGAFGRWIYNQILKGEVVIVVLGDLMEEGIRSTLLKRNLTLDFVKFPAFIDDESFQCISHSSSRKLKVDARVKIGFMSNLIPEKGVFEFCKSIEILSKSNPGFDFWIAGKKLSGVDYSILDELIKKGHVVYYEFISGKSKWDLLCDTDVFVLPTYYSTEYLPLSIIDALVAGCVIVSCDTGEIAEYISNDNGLLIEPRSIAALNDILEKLAAGDVYKYDRLMIRNNIITRLDQFRQNALDELLCQ